MTFIPTAMDGREWDVAEREPCRTLEELADRLLARRGLSSDELSDASPDDLHDPKLLLNIDRAAERVEQAFAKREGVLLLGDYDVDGLCGTTLLYEALQRKYPGCTESGNRTLRYHIPDRFREGYGLQPHIVPKLKERGVKLVITIDNGTSAHRGVEALQKAGIDVLVTDHHLPDQSIPPAQIILNPNQPGCAYPNKDLCGAGVTWKLVERLLGRVEAMQWIDLLGTATVADVVRLRGENRTLVRLGLQKIRQQPHRALRCLFEERNRSPHQAISEDLAFWIAPLLNASNRIPRKSSELNPALLLLIEGDAKGDLAFAKYAARFLKNAPPSKHRGDPGAAPKLFDLFEARRALQEANQERLERTIELQRSRAIHVLVSEDSEKSHEGIDGLLAAETVMRTGKPTFSITMKADGTAKGSGRGIDGYHLKEALDRLKVFSQQYGGHRKAAGVTLSHATVSPFREALFRDAADKLRHMDLRPRLDVDALITPELLSTMIDEQREECAALLAYLGPFGEGNRPPALLAESVHFTGFRNVGPLNRHLRAETPFGSMMGFFKGAPRSRDIHAGTNYDLVITPSEQGSCVGLFIESLRRSVTQTGALQSSGVFFEELTEDGIARALSVVKQGEAL